MSVGRYDMPASRGHVCGGVRIAQWLVLTARHCIEDGPGLTEPHDLAIYGGADLTAASTRSRARVTRIHRSPGTWREWRAAGADLAILQVEQRGAHALPTMAIAGEEHASWMAPGTTARVAGWGIGRDASIRLERGFGPSPTVLHEARLPLRSANACAVRLRGWPGVDKMICAGTFEVPATRRVEGRQACYGDSGGPLVVEDPAGVAPPVVAGIVSGGTSLECAGGLGTYADVRRARAWIDAVVAAHATVTMPGRIAFLKADGPNRHGIFKVHPQVEPDGHQVAVEVRDGRGDQWREVARAASSPIDVRLSPTFDGTGQVRVRLVRDDGVEGPASLPKSMTTGRDRAAPTDPRGFTARRRGTMHYLRWVPSRDDDQVLGYIVEQRTPRGRWQFDAWIGCPACWTNARARPAARTKLVLLPGRRQFRIAAIDRAGNWSQWVESGVTAAGPNG